jgi:glycosyltransferase involved in cell wall biosynthesis
LPGFLRTTPPDPARVAILLGMFNGAPFLRDQLESIGRQTHRNWTLHIRDDGSRDDSIDVAKCFAATMPGRDIRIDRGAHRGFARNFLTLLGAVPMDADAVAFCDQDDVWLPGKLTHALTLLARIPAGRPALYCGRTILTDRALSPIGASPEFTRPPSFRNALVQNIAGGNTMVMNRAALDLARISADYRGPIPAHDWFIYQLVTGADGTVIYDRAPQVLYRQHGGNLIGANQGMVARLRRIAALSGGQFQRWSDQNLDALGAVSPLLTPDNREILDRFRGLRASRPAARLRELAQTGLHRQTRCGNAALWMAAALGKI